MAMKFKITFESIVGTKTIVILFAESTEDAATRIKEYQKCFPSATSNIREIEEIIENPVSNLA